MRIQQGRVHNSLEAIFWWSDPDRMVFNHSGAGGMHQLIKTSAFKYSHKEVATKDAPRDATINTLKLKNMTVEVKVTVAGLENSLVANTA